jgi:hypothetical protein
MSKQGRGKARDVFFALLGDRPVAYHPMIARVLGDVKQALFVCQLLYWHDKGKLPEGWIWKKQDDWTEETGLSRYEQETARKHLKAKGVLEEDLRGIPATLHYKLNLDRLYELVEAYQHEEEAANLPAETPPTSMQEPPNQDWGNPTNLYAETPHTIPENTTKNTKEDRINRENQWWQFKLQELRGSMDKATFNHLLGEAHLLSLEGDNEFAVIEVRTQAAKDMLEMHYLNLIPEILGVGACRYVVSENGQPP